MRRATLFRLLKLAVNTYRPFVAIWRSSRLRYRRPIPKANTHTPWLFRASAGVRTRSCEMPSVMTTRAFKKIRNNCYWRCMRSRPSYFSCVLGEREEVKAIGSCFHYLECSPASSKQSIKDKFQSFSNPGTSAWVSDPCDGIEYAGFAPASVKI